VVCGDGLRNSSTEDCDDGNTLSDGNGCAANCEYNNTCGNGRVEVSAEDCDDGDTIDDGDGCGANCERNAGFCGDDIIQAGVEVCDPPTGDATCDDDCTANVCGDGLVNWASENCDDGDLQDGDGCNSNCFSGNGELCGNGIDDDADGNSDCFDDECVITEMCS
jgi:cysteine-rich repeat protein